MHSPVPKPAKCLYLTHLIHAPRKRQRILLNILFDTTYQRQRLQLTTDILCGLLSSLHPGLFSLTEHLQDATMQVHTLDLLFPREQFSFKHQERSCPSLVLPGSSQRKIALVGLANHSSKCASEIWFLLWSKEFIKEAYLMHRLNQSLFNLISF